MVSVPWCILGLQQHKRAVKMADDFDEYAEALNYEENYDGGVVFYIETERPGLNDDLRPERNNQYPEAVGGNVRRSHIEAAGCNKKEPQRISITIEGTDSDPAPVDLEVMEVATPKQQPNEIMNLFQKREKAFQDEILLLPAEPTRSRQQKRQVSPLGLPSSGRSSRSTSMSPSRQFAGIESLNSLVKLMEHLGKLRKENISLSKRCCYLQDSKELLQCQLIGLKFGHNSRSRAVNRSRTLRKKKPRSCDPPSVASDGSDLEMGVDAITKHHRSHSVGSIDLADISALQAKVAQYEEKGPQRLAAKSRKRFSKWSKSVKKAFVGKMETITRRSSTVTAPQEILSQMRHINSKPQLIQSKSADYGMLNSEPGESDVQDETLSTIQAEDLEPPSPVSVKSEPVPDLVVREREKTPTLESEVVSDQRESVHSEGSGLPSAAPECEEENKAASDGETERINYLKSRRKSSPHVSSSDLAGLDDEEEDEDLALSSPFRRSASFREGSRRDRSNIQQKPRKSHRTAWGRVKDIIQVRKQDSLKHKKRSNSAGTELCASETYEDERRAKSADVEDRNKQATSNETSSAAVTPQPQQKTVKTQPESPPDGTSDTECGSRVIPGGKKQVDIQALIGGLSDEFTKKMQEWEQKKTRKSVVGKEPSFEASLDKQSANFSEDFIRRMEEWEKKMKEKNIEAESESQFEPEAITPRMEELQETLSEQFQKTVQEWHRVKSKRSCQPEGGSPTPEQPPTQTRPNKEERGKSKERDRSRPRVERSRVDRELQRVEKELQKLEQKQQKIGREKSKLQHMKEQLEMSSPESSYGADYRFDSMATDMVKQSIAEEKMDGILKKKLSYSELKRAEDDTLETTMGKSVESGGDTRDIQCRKRSTSSSVTDVSKEDSQTPASPNMVDDSTSIDGRITGMDTLFNFETENNELHQTLKKKNHVLSELEKQVHSLSQKLETQGTQHKKQIEVYKRELWASSRFGQEQADKKEMSAAMTDLKSKLDKLREYGDQLAGERKILENQMLEQMKARDAMETKLMAELRNLQLQLSSETPDKEAEPAYEREDRGEYDKLYEYILNLQDKLNHMKLGVVERNKVIGEMKRHLLLQEVNNLLLQSDVAQRDLEVQYFKEARKSGAIKRWKTFTGMDSKYRDNMQRGEKQPTKSPQRRSFMDFEDCLRDLKNVEHDLDQLNSNFNRLEEENSVDTVTGMQKLLSKLQASSKPAGKASDKKVLMRNRAVEMQDAASQTCDNLRSAQHQDKAVQTCQFDGSLSPSMSEVPTFTFSNGAPVGPSTSSLDSGFLSSPSPQMVKSMEKGMEDPVTPKDMEVSFTFTLPSDCMVSSRMGGSVAKPRMGISVESHIGKQRRQWMPISSAQSLTEEADLNSGEYTRSLDRPRKPITNASLNRLTTSSPVEKRFSGLSTGSDLHSQSFDSDISYPSSPSSYQRYPRDLRKELKTGGGTQSWEPSSHKPHSHYYPRCTQAGTNMYADNQSLQSAGSLPWTTTSSTRGTSRIKTAVATPTPWGARKGQSLMHSTSRTDKEKEKKVDVRDMISRFEIKAQESDASGHEYTPPRNTPSPPPIRSQISPVHRLKTASELMKESGCNTGGSTTHWGRRPLSYYQRSSFMSDSSGSRQNSFDHGDHTVCGIKDLTQRWPIDKDERRVEQSRYSPDKEKGSSRVKAIIKQLSRETTPDEVYSPERRSSTGSAKGELIEKTLVKLCSAGMHVPDISSGVYTQASSGSQVGSYPTYLTQESLSGQPSWSSQEIDRGTEGVVSKRASQFETSRKSDHERSTAVIIPVQRESPQQSRVKASPVPVYHYDTGRNSPEFIHSSRAMQKHGDAKYSPSTSQAGKTIASFFFPAQGSKSSRLFGGGKKEAKSQKSSAISHLCKQALSIDVDNPQRERKEGTWNNMEEAEGVGGAGSMQGDSPQIGTRDKRRGKSKFLDSNWLQKPKRLFRVSNVDHS